MKYALHPGYIISIFDNQKHFVGFSDLVILYKLNINDCIMWDPDYPSTYYGRRPEDYIHLYPQTYGKYTIKE